MIYISLLYGYVVIYAKDWKNNHDICTKIHERDSFRSDFTIQRFLLNLAKNSGFTEKKIETKLDSFIGFLHPIALT